MTLLLKKNNLFQIVACETLEKDNIHDLITEVVGDGIFTATGENFYKKNSQVYLAISIFIF